MGLAAPRTRALAQQIRACYWTFWDALSRRALIPWFRYNNCVAGSTSFYADPVRLAADKEVTVRSRDHI